jgi:hypothetical protein
MTPVKLLVAIYVTGISFVTVITTARHVAASSLIITLSGATSPEQPLSKGNISTPIALLQRKDWEVTKEMTDRVCTHKTFGVFSRHKTTKLWWSKDNAGHGGSVWKVFDEVPKSLEWKADADRYGDFITGKHKGTTGTSILFSQLSCR